MEETVGTYRVDLRKDGEFFIPIVRILSLQKREMGSYQSPRDKKFTLEQALTWARLSIAQEECPADEVDKADGIWEKLEAEKKNLLRSVR